MERFRVREVGISCVNIEKALQIIDKSLEYKATSYVCVTNTHTAFLANTDKYYSEIQNNSLLTVPDGAPLVWLAHRNGIKKVGKVSGKDLMDRVFSISKEKNYSHFFYGSTKETLNKLQSNLENGFPGINIKGVFSPPFQPIEDFDIEGLAEMINELEPTFFWCGLGAPKQEILISRLQPLLTNTVCIGVGLAFDYFAGTVKRAPVWMQKNGLEWVYRLSQQPQKIKREIKPFSWMLKQLLISYVLPQNNSVYLMPANKPVPATDELVTEH